MTTNGSRSTPTPPDSPCKNTFCGSSRSRSSGPRQLAIARAIVDAISDDGYITESLDEIANTLRPEIECDSTEVEAVLAGVQALDPAGIGARSVGECIELQLRQLDPATPGTAPRSKSRGITSSSC